MRLKLAAAALAALLLAPAATRAQTCSVSVDHSMAFGNYLPSSSLPNDTSANVIVSCNATVALLIPFGIKLQSASGRTMSGPGGTLSYQLASDVLFAESWPNERTVNGVILLTILNLLGTQLTPVYGRLPPGQLAKPGSYTDSLMVVLTY